MNMNAHLIQLKRMKN